MTIRLVAAIVGAAIACLIGGLILGEYEFTGATPFGAGVLFGLVVSELVIEIGRRRSIALGVLCAAMVGGALWRAAYISSGKGLRPFPSGGWIAVVLGALTVGVRVAWPARDMREPRDVTTAD